MPSLFTFLEPRFSQPRMQCLLQNKTSMFCLRTQADQTDCEITHNVASAVNHGAVSYTHLDVYKRQMKDRMK